MHPWFNILAAGGKSGASTANFCTELRLPAASGPLSGLCLAKYLCLPPAGPPHLKDCLGAHRQVMLGMSERPEDFPSCKEVRGLCSSPIPSGPSAARWPCADIPLKTCMSPATPQIRQKQLCFISITLGFVNCHPYPSIGWSSLVCSPSFNMPISHCQTDYTDYSINILYSANGEEIVLFW